MPFLSILRALTCSILTNCELDVRREPSTQSIIYLLFVLQETSTHPHRPARRKDATYSPTWFSGANLLAHMQVKYILFVPTLAVTTLRLSLFVFGESTIYTLD